MRLLLLFLLISPILGQAQSPTKNFGKFINFLLQEEYISPEESSLIHPDSLFTSIHEVYVKRYNLERGEERFMYFSNQELEEKTERLIKKLHNLALIDSPTFEDLMAKFQNRHKKSVLLSETITDDFMLFKYLYELEKYQESHEQVLAYLQGLQEKQIIPQNHALRNLPRSKVEIFQLLANKRIIFLDSLPKSVEDFYRILYEKTSDLDPSLKVEDYQFSIEEIKSEGYAYQSAVVKFNLDGIHYRAAHRYKDDYEDEETKYVIKLDFQAYQWVLNKVLANRKSQYRLVMFGSENEKACCFFLLNQEQYKILLEGDNYMEFLYFDPLWYKIGVSKYWNPFKLLSIQETETYFKALDSIGLFAHLDKTEKEEAREHVKHSYLTSAISILYKMDNIFLAFDWEMSNGNKPYQKAIEEFAAITHGEFNPTNIQDDFSFSSDQAHIAFDFRGKTYSTTVEVMGDWYSEDFLDLIYRAVEEHDLSGKYYDLPSGGQVSSHIYLSQKQYEYLGSHKLLSFNKSDY